jgi:hypothetical protein
MRNNNILKTKELQSLHFQNDSLIKGFSQSNQISLIRFQNLFKPPGFAKQKERGGYSSGLN